MSHRKPSTSQRRRWPRGSQLLALSAWGVSLGVLIILGTSRMSLHGVLIMCCGVTVTLLVVLFMLLHRNMARIMRSVQLVRSEGRATQRAMQGAIDRTALRMDANHAAVTRQLGELQSFGTDLVREVTTEIRIARQLTESSNRQSRVSSGDLAAVEGAVFDLLCSDLDATAWDRAERASEITER